MSRLNIRKIEQGDNWNTLQHSATKYFPSLSISWLERVISLFDVADEENVKAADVTFSEKMNY